MPAQPTHPTPNPAPSDRDDASPTRRTLFKAGALAAALSAFGLRAPTAWA